MKRKGVSPVIATVLLIGMVVVLALIIFLWMRSLAQETITKFEGENIELACDKVDFEVSKVGGQLSVSNIGSVPIFDIKLRISIAGGHVTEGGREVFGVQWPGSGLNPGGVFSGNYEKISGADVVVIPVLLGSSESGSQKTYTCNEKRHGKEAL